MSEKETVHEDEPSSPVEEDGVLDPITMYKVEKLDRDPRELYEVLDVLGEGAYGQIFKVRSVADGKCYAAKVVKMNPVEADDVLKELTFIQSCDYKHIIKGYGSYFYENKLWIIIELCEGGSVSDVQDVLKRTLTEEEIAFIVRETLDGLQYLHSLNKIHRDIKGGNILLSGEGLVKLADFGVSAELDDHVGRRRSVIGSPYWMAPEVIKNEPYSDKADIWSLGITMIEMGEGRPPLSECGPMRAFFLIPKHKVGPTWKNPSKWSPGCIDFLSKCLAMNPLDRPPAKQLLVHPWMLKQVIRRMRSRVVLGQLILDVHSVFDQYGGRAGYLKHLEELEYEKAMAIVSATFRKNEALAFAAGGMGGPGGGGNPWAQGPGPGGGPDDDWDVSDDDEESDSDEEFDAAAALKKFESDRLKRPPRRPTTPHHQRARSRTFDKKGAQVAALKAAFEAPRGEEKRSRSRDDSVGVGPQASQGSKRPTSLVSDGIAAIRDRLAAASQASTVVVPNRRSTVPHRPPFQKANSNPSLSLRKPSDGGPGIRMFKVATENALAETLRAKRMSVAELRTRRGAHMSEPKLSRKALRRQAAAVEKQRLEDERRLEEEKHRREMEERRKVLEARYLDLRRQKIASNKALREKFFQLYLAISERSFVLAEIHKTLEDRQSQMEDYIARRRIGLATKKPHRSGVGRRSRTRSVFKPKKNGGESFVRERRASSEPRRQSFVETEGEEPPHGLPSSRQAGGQNCCNVS